MSRKEPPTIRPRDRQQWRDWLADNHEREEGVWVIYHKKNSKTPSMDWDQAVEEALCFGWIDSKRQPIDETTFRQFFSKRKPNGTWSKINKARVARLTREGLMTKAGLAAIATAKKNGAWTFLDDVEELTIPADLKKALKSSKGSEKNFLQLSRSVKRMMLLSLAMSKRPETRQKRIKEIVTTCSRPVKK